MKRVPGTPARILLLDRNTDDIKRLEEIIEKEVVCEFQLADSVKAALDEINREKPDLIISEWPLLDLTAAELLQIIRKHERWADIPVIVSTSTRTQEVKLRAKQLGAYDFMQKPVNQYRLRWHLRLLLSDPGSHVIVPTEIAGEDKEKEEYRESIDRQQIRRILRVNPLPEVAQRVIEISHNPNSTSQELADAIKRDQALTSRILKIVNSAYYGFPRNIGNIDRAVVILGFDEIINITQAECMLQSFPASDSSPYFNLKEFWIHSLATAHIARSLSNLKKGLNSKDAFVMGLMHDFGKMAMNQHFNEVFNHLLEQAAQRQEPLHIVSLEVIDIDHADIGGLIGEEWILPTDLVKAIQFHHNPGLVRGDQYEVHMTHLANYFCHRQGIGSSGNPVPGEPFTGSLKAFGLDKKDLDEVWASFNVDADHIRSIV